MISQTKGRYKVFYEYVAVSWLSINVLYFNEKSRKRWIFATRVLIIWISHAEKEGYNSLYNGKWHDKWDAIEGLFPSISVTCEGRLMIFDCSWKLNSKWIFRFKATFKKISQFEAEVENSSYLRKKAW